MLAEELEAAHSQNMAPCLTQGQTLARAVDLRQCKTVVAVACCRIDAREEDAARSPTRVGWGRTLLRLQMRRKR